MANGSTDPSELFSTGLKFLGEAVKQFGRETKDEVKVEGRQMRDAWADVTDKIKPADPRKAKETESPSPRDELLFGLLSRGVTALESIADSLKPAGRPSFTPPRDPDPRLRGV